MKNINKVVGENIKALRVLRHLSQEGLAQVAHIDQTYVSAIERGVRSPALDTLAQIAAALCCEFLDLLKDTTPEEAGNNPDSPDSTDDVSSLSSYKTELLNNGIVIYTNGRGERYEVPATPEGYAFLKEVKADDQRSLALDKNNIQ